MSAHDSAVRRRTAAAALCAAALALAGCGSSGPSAGAAPGTSQAAGAGTATSAAVITIKDFAFTTPASVSPGAKITVHNLDGLAHTVSADNGNAFDSPAPAGNSSFTAPSKPGSYPFHCTIHPEMHGTLVVR
jgi:plastocyanin